MIAKGLVAFGLLILFGCGETTEKSFPSMSLPEAQGMVSRGWIPAVLPSTATDIQVRSNLDTNMVRGTARIREVDVPGLRSALRPLADDAVPPFWPKGNVTPPWWPEELRPPSRTSELRARGWELFAVPDKAATYMALRRSDGRLYFWGESP